MQKSKITIYYIVIALLSGLAIYFFFRTHQLKKQVQSITLSNESSNEDAWMQQTLAGIDSLLSDGQYIEAIEMYEALDTADIAGLSYELTWRIRLAKTLSEKHSILPIITHKVDSNTNNDMVVTAVRDANPMEVRQYDSLNFALKKANLKIENLRLQISRRSDGEYLAFTTSKGKELYYVGEVKNNQANGKGVAILVSGSRYEGEWKDNMRDGEGMFFWHDGQHYEGSYKNDKRHGKGTYYWPNGEKYIGEWENDHRNGQGTFYGADDKVVSGIWKKDKLVTVSK